MPVLEEITSTSSHNAMKGKKDLSRSVEGQVFQLAISVSNKRGMLARVAQLVSQRGLRIESLNYSTAHKGNTSVLYVTLRGQRAQVQGLLNDARKISEIKGIDLDAPQK